MSDRPPMPPDVRLLELQADRALGWQDLHEERELDRLRSELGAVDDRTLDTACGALAAAFAGRPEPMPGDLHERLSGDADRFLQGSIGSDDGKAAASSDAPGARLERVGQGDPEPGESGPVAMIGPFGWAGWAAAAVFAIAAVIGWRSAFVVPADGSGIIEARQALLDDPQAVQLEWKAWENSLTPDVEGDVVWDDQTNRGYMRFVAMPPNDENLPAYQLWIVDAEMGFDRRVSGGVFTVEPGQTEVVVPIDPAHPISKAAGFAVTVEKPGGVGVSTMERKAVIALRDL